MLSLELLQNYGQLPEITVKKKLLTLTSAKLAAV